MGIHRRHWIKMTVAALAVAWLGIIPLAGSAQAAEKVTVFAAASLKNALDDITAAWQKESGKEAAISYAASSALAKQIESGAPADIFISADLDWMDYVAKKNLIKADTRKNLLGNRIVLVASKDKAEPVEIKKGFDLAKLLGEGRLAMGAVDSVPAGKYGKAALESLVCGRQWKARLPARRACARHYCWCRVAKRPMASSIRRMRRQIKKSRS